MAKHKIVVIGGSAGALKSLIKILRELPEGFPAAIFVVIHTAPMNRGFLSAILQRNGKLTAETADDGTAIRAGHIYVAPPDHHLLIKNGCMKVTRGPRENGFRPALDPLFRTAAVGYGANVIAVILSGGGDDGVLGLAEVKRYGGVVIAQDPDDAESPSMPEHAIDQIEVDHVLPADDMAAVISGLVRKWTEDEPEVMSDQHPDTAEAGSDALDTGELPGPPTPFRCPECGGALWEIRDGQLFKYQCHVGHTYGSDSLAAAQADEVEQALWTALRALEESSALRRRMALHARERGMTAIADSYDDHAEESEARARLLRRTILSEPIPVKAPASS